MFLHLVIAWSMNLNSWLSNLILWTFLLIWIYNVYHFQGFSKKSGCVLHQMWFKWWIFFSVAKNKALIFNRNCFSKEFSSLCQNWKTVAAGTMMHLICSVIVIIDDSNWSLICILSIWIWFLHVMFIWSIMYFAFTLGIIWRPKSLP